MDLINKLRGFGFWDVQDFILENDQEIIRETLAEVEEVKRAEHDPEKLRQRIIEGVRYQRLRNPGGYLREEVRKRMALHYRDKGPKQ